MDQGVNERDRPVNVRPDQGGERPRVEIYDPPLCCPTGLCGPTADPVLLDLNEALITLKSKGVTSARYSLSANPQAFVSNPDVFRLLREKQIAVLPITAVDGNIVKTGAYPSLAELLEFPTRDKHWPGQ